MIETVFALILTLNGNMIEHVYKNEPQRLFEIKAYRAERGQS